MRSSHKVVATGEPLSVKPRTYGTVYQVLVGGWQSLHSPIGQPVSEYFSPLWVPRDIHTSLRRCLLNERLLQWPSNGQAAQIRSITVNAELVESAWPVRSPACPPSLTSLRGLPIICFANRILTRSTSFRKAAPAIITTAAATAQAPDYMVPTAWQVDVT